MSDKQDELKEFRQNPNRSSGKLYTDCRPKFVGWGKENARLDGHDLVDIFQNAVLIAVLNIESGRLSELTGSLCTYVFGICKNLIQAFRRKRARTSLPGEDFMPKEQNVESGVETTIIADQEKESLWSKVDALGEPTRSLLILTYQEGLKSQEIADIMGYSSPEVVRQLRKRAIDKLRKGGNALQ